MPSGIVEEVVSHRAAMQDAEEMAKSERVLMLNAMRRARQMGISYQTMADAIGLSRQRVFDMMKDDERKRTRAGYDPLF